jgi:hypothetical protein
MDLSGPLRAEKEPFSQASAPRYFPQEAFAGERRAVQLDGNIGAEINDNFLVDSSIARPRQVQWIGETWLEVDPAWILHLIRR